MSHRQKNCEPCRSKNSTIGGLFAIGLLWDCHHCDLGSLRKELDQVLATFQPEFVDLILQFVAGGGTPASMWQVEKELLASLRELGRKAIEIAVNRLEPESPDALPKRVEHEGVEFSRKNAKTCERGGIGTLFGEIELQRFSYEPLSEAKDAGMKSFVPLLERLGIVAHNATPALAEVVARDAADRPEDQTLLFLKHRHGVDWSPQTLRAVRAAVAKGIDEHLLAAQAKRLLEWMKAAAKIGRVILCVGRDGIFLPIRGQKDDRWKEGAVGTITVLARVGRGRTKRMGTVYLGQMPSPQQLSLSRDLTSLLNQVLTQWDARNLELVYVTDAGYHPTEYYEQVLEPMEDPKRPGKRLAWQRIVDFYHASQRIWQLAPILFRDSAAANAWARRMCHVLKHEPNAVHKILHSAAALKSTPLRGKARENYNKAYYYLLNHRDGMDYCEYRRKCLPIGSGITEAACKTVFTQRFKCSGMTWKRTTLIDDAPLTGGQAVLILRLAALSGVWDDVFESYIAAQTTSAKMATRPSATDLRPKQAA